VRTWIILDVSYLCYRAFYATGGLSYREKSTGAAYGLFRDLITLENRFGSRHFVFCFDHGPGLREKEYPAYKLDRRRLALQVSQAENLRRIRSEIQALREDYLPQLGYCNVFSQPGYEADDVIASVVHGLGGREHAVIVSADQDLYQLLGPGVACYKPGEPDLFTEQSFRAKHGIPPGLWATALAIMGGHDNIQGVMGAGEVKTARYLREDLDPGSKICRDIMRFTGSAEFRQNLRLCKLPFPGAQKFRPEPHPPVGEEDWSLLMGRLGIKTLNLPGVEKKAVRHGIIP
jgi:5'-3' exonuclease